MTYEIDGFTEDDDNLAEAIGKIIRDYGSFPLSMETRLVKLVRAREEVMKVEIAKPLGKVWANGYDAGVSDLENETDTDNPYQK